MAFTFNTAAAQGRFEVKPHVEVDMQRDSNFNHSESNEKNGSYLFRQTRH